MFSILAILQIDWGGEKVARVLGAFYGVLKTLRKYISSFSHNIHENWHSGTKNLAGTAKKHTHNATNQA